jgi:hypothetical protein
MGLGGLKVKTPERRKAKQGYGTCMKRSCTYLSLNKCRVTISNTHPERYSEGRQDL